MISSVCVYSSIELMCCYHHIPSTSFQVFLIHFSKFAFAISFQFCFPTPVSPCRQIVSLFLNLASARSSRSTAGNFALAAISKAFSNNRLFVICHSWFWHVFIGLDFWYPFCLLASIYLGNLVCVFFCSSVFTSALANWFGRLVDILVIFSNYR